ncbi:uncharacterized protein EI97DRAFT_455455 [Westerdykella ornata]|uniref:Uncharacterized protein n=1 Tax=Westerdykella ornata TaxID=318751 RepID=A0A6A6JSE0_WESOR|nr:uncharacterized protein EI97DRAFT_455455 [Westerdykella ornata]KAF2279175.1 hypothetical protein EI97DRAFT_455455 [Westerdykella ornata]
MKTAVILCALVGGMVSLATATPQTAAGPRADIDTLGSVGDAVATTCDECSKRYKHCIDLAFVPGLPNCERICKNRVMRGDGACKSCGDSFYPGFPRTTPPIKYERT